MMNKLSILQNASALMRHAAARHNVIAENIAKADLPGYKARALPAFDVEAVERARQGDRSEMARMHRAAEIPGLTSAPNGNTVQLDEQMARAADAQAQHGAALAIYRQTLDLLRSAGNTRI
ncbi:MAG: flagellar biosynthesis protein FlgB [Pseudomonadota bacterium]